MTIHRVGLDMSNGMSIGLLQMRMAMARRMMFLMNVSMLLSTMASPKQPQSFTGSAMTIQSVISVITAITSRVSLLTSLLRMAKSRKMPMANSHMASRTDITSVLHDGNIQSICSASR